MPPASNLARYSTRIIMEHPKTASHVFVGVLAFAFGSIVTSNIYSFLSSRKRIGDRENAGASREFNDLSFFYGDEKALTTVERNCSHLPGDFYGQLVRDCIVACVDCVIVRVNAVNDTKQCILVERKDEPMKGEWWFPGGRMFKGETFFDAALRKCKEETGLKGNAVQILTCTNTFFPTSSWDIEGIKGTQTMNAVVLVEVADGSEVLLDKTSDRFRWTSTDPDDFSTREEDKYIVNALNHLKAWNNTFKRAD
ncbi:hypothetical protein TrLO_g15844 [Triparma laevis f. longispina]|uniref:Nudix hydrolase domain-containing protein n=1 Tax=Triparma laevis f. longispina TaxID=1714387 RepID=A0A9W7AMM9_9STRA|nr:hypothetical protein TrLO_g15844 [Triparma laevis f. longispina]